MRVNETWRRQTIIGTRSECSVVRRAASTASFLCQISFNLRSRPLRCQRIGVVRDGRESTNEANPGSEDGKN